MNHVRAVNRATKISIDFRAEIWYTVAVSVYTVRANISDSALLFTAGKD